jgi:hypothetical protein
MDTKKTITGEQWAKFCVEYWTDPKFSGQRVGQAFCNEFRIDHDNELFYSSDTHLCYALIATRYLEV